MAHFAEGLSHLKSLGHVENAVFVNASFPGKTEKDVSKDELFRGMKCHLNCLSDLLRSDSTEAAHNLIQVLAKSARRRAVKVTHSRFRYLRR